MVIAYKIKSLGTVIFLFVCVFIGKSHMDQIKRIIEKLGTPSEEYLKMASTNLITDIILSWY